MQLILIINIISIVYEEYAIWEQDCESPFEQGVPEEWEAEVEAFWPDEVVDEWYYLRGGAKETKDHSVSESGWSFG